MPPIVYLVDASTFIHRSYHAIPRLTTKDGRPTNAIYGFVASLTKILREKSPQLMAVVYDTRGPSFRHQLDPHYKANRPPMEEDLIVQQEPIRRMVHALGLKAVEVPGLEADDVIATLTKQALASGAQVVIVSSDKDFYQLLGDQVSMYDPNPKKETNTNVRTLQEKFGLTPEEFLEAQGLMGDSTDNIPGVPGIGEKTAAKLIQKYHTLENLYDRLPDITPEKLRGKLAEHRTGAFLSRDLARLKKDADLGLTMADLKVHTPNQSNLRAMYRDLEFTRFAAELEPERTISQGDYHLVDTPEALQAVVDELSGVRYLAIDLETTSVDPMVAEIVGLSLCGATGLAEEEGNGPLNGTRQPRRAFYVPMAHRTLGAAQLDWPQVRNTLKPLLEDLQVAKVNQNIKYDYIILRRHGLDLKPITDDPMVASYVLEPGTGGHNLNDLSRKWLNHDPITYQQVVGKQPGFDYISPEEARDYACEDADVALALTEVLRKRLKEEGLLRLYEDLEMPLVPVLAEMEMTGVGLDVALLADLSKDLARRMDQMEERIYVLAGHRFNVNSPKQLGSVLFEELKLPQGKKTQKKTGYSTDVEVLTDLAALHELPAEILNYRTLAKLKSTYIDALPQLINPATGRLHTSFNQAVTATGRLSSSDPNLQNIPIRTEEGRQIRQAFIARSGWLLLAADYSQIELRILAHYSKDRGLREAFLAGDDIHTRTAAEVFHVLPGLVTPDLRRQAKAINFGIVYGQQAFGLAKQLGIDRKTAQRYIDQYFDRYAGVKAFIDQTLTLARQTGYVTTLLGRRRYLPDLTSSNHLTRSMAERMAVNTPIQGTAADIIKLAMLAVHRAMELARVNARMVLQVHDELVFEVPESEMAVMLDLVRREMQGVMNLDVPLIVDVQTGANWAEAH